MTARSAARTVYLTIPAQKAGAGKVPSTCKNAPSNTRAITRTSTATSVDGGLAPIPRNHPSV